jgi:hypothetical protein
MPYLRDVDAAPAVRLHILVAILAVALGLAMAVQTVGLVRDREALASQRAAQESAFQEAFKLRQQLISLAGKTAQLAEQGDANAAVIVERLRQQGVTINLPPGAVSGTK